MDAAYGVQREFENQLLDAGRRALAELERTGEPGLVLLGRSYNLYDHNINCDVPRKLRRNYGANVIPLDFLVTGRESVADLHPNMYWPDSYIKHFARQAAGAPLLVLQFDGHGNDAGYMTRCEAYLDSKGILRCYNPLPTEPQPKAIAVGAS